MAVLRSHCGCCGTFIRHQWLIRERQRAACFQAFDESKWIGVIVLVGLLASYGI